MTPQSVNLGSISKSFGADAVLKGIDLAVRPGEFLSLVGMSGCGKSTLLRIIAGLEAPDEGRVTIGGRDVTDEDSSDRNLAMVFQSYALYPHMTVRQNIATPLRMRRLPLSARLPLVGRLVPGLGQARRDIDVAVREAAATLQIEQLLDRKPSQLSGGQRQRVALARALVRAPAAFLMDEPLSNLDAKLRGHMREELSGLHRRLGATFIYVTHDQVEAMTMSDRIALMSEGRIEQLGTPDELYRHPETLTVAQFIGSPTINLLPAEVQGTGNVTIYGRDTGIRGMQADAGPATVGLRSEDLHVAADGLPLRVSRVESQGADRFVTGHLLHDTSVTLTFRQAAGEVPVEGIVHLSFVRDRIHLFGADGRRRPITIADRMAA